jgi:hypothetical protein
VQHWFIAMQALLVGTVVGVVAAGTPAFAEVLDEPPRPQRRCKHRPYLDGGTYVGLGSHTAVAEGVHEPDNSGVALLRLSAGGIFRRCDVLGQTMYDLRGGLSYGRNSIKWTGSSSYAMALRTSAIGFETEGDFYVHPRVALGLRLGVERIDAGLGDAALLLSIGPRARFLSTFWVGVDLFIVPSGDGPSCSDGPYLDCEATTVGALVGIGMDSRYVTVVTAAGLLIGLIALIGAVGG